MSRRLPKPTKPKWVRLLVSDDELYEMEKAAADSRLSLASFARAVVAYVADQWPEHRDGVKAKAEQIVAETPPDQARPGRPKKRKGKP